MKKVRIIALFLVVTLLAVMMVACVPSNPDTAIKRLTNYDYTISDDITSADTVKYAEVSARYGEGIQRYVLANSGNHRIVIIYFANKEQAKSAKAILEAELNKYISENSPKVSFEVNIAGKIAYAGTDAAIKIVKNVVNA